MTVRELKEQLQKCNDDSKVILTSDCIYGTSIDQDFFIQTNDGDDNSPVFIEFDLRDVVFSSMASYNDTMDRDELVDWFINSVSPDDKPVWTEEHIDELLYNFYVIPKDQ